MTLSLGSRAKAFYCPLPQTGTQAKEFGPPQSATAMVYRSVFVTTCPNQFITHAGESGEPRKQAGFAQTT